ncbi:MAG: protein sorting system archaetidylserine synthase [Halodesulfurarchaeum sp.]
MGPRALRALSPADLITAANAVIGFVAIAVATRAPGLAARLVLLAGITDALDGIVARRWGGSAVGPYLDSLADVASFGVGPAIMVVGIAGVSLDARAVLPIALGGVFVGAAVVRLALYTAYDTDQPSTRGVQTTLAATILAAGLLAGVPRLALVVGLGGFAVLMLSEAVYPDLRVRDGLLMGGIQALALGLPNAFGAVFPKALLAWALAYLVLGPRFYPGPEGKRS